MGFIVIFWMFYLVFAAFMCVVHGGDWWYYSMIFGLGLGAGIGLITCILVAILQAFGRCETCL